MQNINNYLTNSSVTNYLTTSSINNYKDVCSILNLELFELTEINTFLNDNIILKNTFNKFLNLYENYKLILQKNIEIEHFDPTNVTLFIKKYNVDPNVFNSENGIIKSQFIKLNGVFIYETKIKDILFRLFFYVIKSDTNITILINNLIRRFHIIVSYNENENRYDFLQDIMDHVDHFDIHFILYPLGRTSTMHMVEPDDINKLSNKGCYNASSGYTILHIFNNKNINSNKTMMISRIPEALGLLTHELGHLFGIDFEVPIKNKNTTTISGVVGRKNITESHINKLEKLPIDKIDPNFTEAICNTNTTLIHTMCNAIELGILSKEFNNFNMFKHLFYVEILYSIYHSAKILYWLGYDNFDAFFNNNSKIQYVQKACLFEYSIIRSFMLLLYPVLFDSMLVNDNKYCKFKLDDNIYSSNKWSEETNKKWDDFVDNTLDLMTSSKEQNSKDINLRKSYEKIYNQFIEIIKNTTTNKNTYVESSCGNINMEYFCIDLSYNNNIINKVLYGGNKLNYKKKYMKYKTKYINTINIIR
jgi:hypothetical protein